MEHNTMNQPGLSHQTPPSARLMALLTLIGLTLLAPAAAAQRNRLIERTNPHEWTLQVDLTVDSYQDRYYNSKQKKQIQYGTFNFPALTVIFPAISETAGSKINDKNIAGELSLNDILADDSPKLIPLRQGNMPFHSGTRFVKWQLTNGTGRQVELSVEIPMTSWRTVFNEDEAMNIDWPKGEWPVVAQSTFEPQYGVDMDLTGKHYDMRPVDRLIKRWINNKPKAVQPVYLAKFLAGEVVRFFQPSGNGINSANNGLIEGIDLMGAPLAAKRGRGSEFDMVTLLVAVYRKAGLPARMVIGLDRSDEDEKFLKRGQGRKAQLHAWVEFCLYDDVKNKEYWIPVDIVRIRQRGSRPPNIDQPWKYFGTHDEMDTMMPFAFNFHPPTRVIAYGSPGFWGWTVDNGPPPDNAFQSLRFRSMTTAQRGGKPNRD